MAESVNVLVDGGKATGGPPLGPALGRFGLNIGQVVKVVNERTKVYAGMKVPVTIEVEPDRSFRVRVGTPPVSALLKKELGMEKLKEGGDIPFDKVVQVAKMKMPSMMAGDLKRAVKEVLGTCVSMRLTVDGIPAKKVQVAIDQGEYDPRIS